MKRISVCDPYLDLDSCQTIRPKFFKINKTFHNKFFFNSSIYALVRSNRIVYVGETHCLIRRISEHYTEKSKEFDGFRIIEMNIENDKERKRRESEYIMILKPYYNQIHKKHDTYLGYESKKHYTAKERKEMGLLPKKIKEGC